MRSAHSKQQGASCRRDRRALGAILLDSSVVKGVEWAYGMQRLHSGTVWSLESVAFNAMRILFGVFDWGLGHATRDVPLIAELLRGNDVHILSTGRALGLLQAHFGEQCTYHNVPSIYPPYTRTRLFKLKFSVSVPKMMRTLRRACRRSRRIIRTGFDIVISDCRYDVYDKPENSYLINHQLRFKTPVGAERVFERWLASRMRKYRYVFVPDYEDRSLTGTLSHELRYIPQEKVKYIGILSRLRKREVPADIDYFVSLSGPEPQRTVLEKHIIAQVGQLQGRVVIAAGQPGARAQRRDADVEYYGYLDADRQEDIMNRAKFVITRSGYTTVMELAELDKAQVLLVPTPGQTEQEYLADHYEHQKCFHHVSQHRLRLAKDIDVARRFRGFAAPWKTADSVSRFTQMLYS